MPQKKILIVDDELGIRNLLNRVLKSEGFDVRMAEDGESAIRQAKEDQPDLVLCDIKMPNKDGIQTLKELKETAEDIEAIMLTATPRWSAVAAMKPERRIISKSL